MEYLKDLGNLTVISATTGYVVKKKFEKYVSTRIETPKLS